MSDSTIKLDIGCGKKKKEGWIGIDWTDYGQEIVRDITRGIPYADETIDEIRALQILEHLYPEDVEFVLKECKRVLKPGGKITIDVPHKDRPEAYIPQHKTYYTEATFRKWAHNNGWKTLQLFSDSRPNVIWVAEKK
jgi:predicted SAM-dependent methyltransferase